MGFPPPFGGGFCIYPLRTVCLTAYVRAEPHHWIFSLLVPVSAASSTWLFTAAKPVSRG